MASNKAKAAAGGALALAIGIVAYFEGTVKKAYVDPAGVLTICTGHTGPDVKPGMAASDEMCRDLLSKDMAWAFEALDKTLDHPEKLEPWTRAAMASFIFNLGAGFWKTTPMPQLLNAGKVAEACRALLPYHMAPKYDKKTGEVVRDPKTGKVVKIPYPGLIKRRVAESQLCAGEGWTK